MNVQVYYSPKYGRPRIDSAKPPSSVQYSSSELNWRKNHEVGQKNKFDISHGSRIV